VYPPETEPLKTEVLSLVENVQRVDLNPIEEAKGYQQLAEKYGLHKTAIAEMVSKERTYISRMLDLLTLPAEIQESVARATLTLRHVRALAQITNTERQIALAKQAEDEDWTVRETEKQVNEELGHVGAGGASPPVSPKGERIGNPDAFIAPPGPEDEMAVLMAQAANVDLEESDTWSFRYGGPGKFLFEVNLQSKDRLAKLAKWAADLSKALGYQDPDTPPAVDLADKYKYKYKYKNDIDVALEQLPDAFKFLSSNASDAEKAAYVKKLQDKGTPNQTDQVQ